MTAADETPPARAMVWCRMAGSGLATPNVSAPQIAAKRARQVQPVEQQLRQPFELVGADRKAIAAAFEVIQRRVQSIERARLVGDMFGVIVDEIARQAIEFLDR